MSGKKSVNSLRKIFSTAFFVYLAAVIYITVLSRAPGERRFDMEPFNSYVLLIRDKNYFYLYQITCNVLMTLPLGIMLPFLSKKYQSFGRVTVCGFLFSLGIETIQYITRRGLFEFDDLFNNTLGASLGYVLFFIFHIYLMAHAGKKR